MSCWRDFIEGFSLDDFEDPARTEEYVDFFALRELLGVQNDSDSGQPSVTPNRIQSVDPENFAPIPPQWPDLARLHWLCLSREVISVVEFGSGQSTAVIAHALKLNEAELSEWVRMHRRHQEPFTLTTVDESPSWLEIAMSRVPANLRNRIKPVSSTVSVGTFAGRVCTFYEGVPEIVADLVYFDGPSQYGHNNPNNLLDIGKAHLMPMAGDILPVEHFFEPGAVIVFDGRTSNARFVDVNLQRGWKHEFLRDSGVHIFELQEESLGPVNSHRLDRLEEISSRFLL